MTTPPFTLSPLSLPEAEHILLGLFLLRLSGREADETEGLIARLEEMLPPGRRDEVWRQAAETLRSLRTRSHGTDRMDMHYVLLEALADGAALDIEYETAQRIITTRRVRVLRVQGPRFDAYCFTRKGERSFLVARVLRARRALESPPEGPPSAPLRLIIKDPNEDSKQGDDDAE